jgi:hypothetical protein
VAEHLEPREPERSPVVLGAEAGRVVDRVIEPRHGRMVRLVINNLFIYEFFFF